MFVVKGITILYIYEFTGICYFCLFVDSIIFSRGINRVWKVPVFGVILVCIQSECGKIRTRITPNTDTFYAVRVVQIKHKDRNEPEDLYRCFHDFSFGNNDDEFHGISQVGRTFT